MPNNFNLRTITTPILINLLKDEFLFPQSFIVWCKLTLSQFKKRMDKRFPAELVELTALPLGFYLNLKNKIWNEKSVREYASGALKSWCRKTELSV